MPTTLEYFIAALNHLLDSGSLKQRDIAVKTKTASQSINAIAKGRKVPGLQKQEEIAVACGYEYVEFLILGRKLLTGEQQPPNQEALDAVTALVEQIVSAALDTAAKLGRHR